MLKRLIFAAFLLLPASRALAEGGPYTLDAAFKAALKQSETYASDLELVYQAQERYTQARAAIMPNINGTATWYRQDDHDRAFANLASQTTYALHLDQPLFRGFREYAALRQAKEAVPYQDLANDWAAMQLYSDTSQAYYQVLALDKDLATQQGEVDLYNKRITELQDFVRIGRSRETDILTVESAKAILVAQIESSKALAAVARDLLSFLTGWDSSVALQDDVELPQTLASMEQYLTQVDSRPDIKAAQMNIDINKENVNIAVGGHLPSVDLMGDYFLQRPVNIVGQTYPVDWDAEIALTLPIFLGGSVISQTHQAESQVRQAELALRLQKRGAQQALRDAYQTVEFDLSQAAALKDAFQITEKNYHAETKDYNNGLVTNLDVLQALTSYQDTQRSLDKAQYACKSDFAHLESLAAKVSLPKTEDQQP
jgi:outer membrane protein TolC